MVKFTEVVKLILRKGLKAQLPILEQGEPAYSTDTKEVFIGTGEQNIALAKQSVVDTLSQQVTSNTTQIGTLATSKADSSVIGGLSSQLNTHAYQIGELQQDVTENSNQIGNLQQDVTENSNQIGNQQKKTDWVDVREAPFNAKGDGVTNDTVAFKAAIAYAGTVKKPLHAPKGVYILSDTIVCNVIMIGEGFDEWVPLMPDHTKKEISGTHLRFVGTGAKTYSVKYTSDMKVAGGWRYNPDGSGENQHYKLLDFTNANATGTNPATPKLLSVGVYVPPTTQQWGIKNMRVVVNNNGLDGYNNKTAGLGDNWDVGVMVDSAEYGVMEDVQIVGYWRMAALLQSHAQNSAGRYEAGCEYNKYIRCMFQGFRGVVIRGGDYFRCTAVTSSTIEVPWTASNVLPSASDIENGIGIRKGTTIFQWTGATQTGDKLTLTGVTPDPVVSGVIVGDTLRNNIYTKGNGGTTFDNCYIGALEHSSLVPSHLLGLGIGVSIPIELNNARGIRFTNCKVQTIEEVIAFLHEADEVVFDNVEFEPSGWKKPDSTSGNTGARFIASESFMTDTDVTYQAGTTTDLTISETCKFLSDNAVDLEPYVTRANTRFTSGSLFTPSSVRLPYKGFTNGLDTVIKMLKGKEFLIQPDGIGTNYVRITSSGNTLLGGQLTVGVGGTAYINSDGTNNMVFRNGTTARFQIFGSSGNFAPSTDNAYTIGTSGLRPSAIHAMQYKMYGVTAGSVGNDTFFKDSADGKVKYKDENGVVNPLY